MWRLLVPGLKLKRFLALIALGFMALGVAMGLSAWIEPYLFPFWRRPVLEMILFVVGTVLVVGGFLGDYGAPLMRSWDPTNGQDYYIRAGNWPGAHTLPP